MISAQTKEGVDFLFGNAVRSCLLLNGDDSMQIEPVTPGKTLDLPGKHVVVLTISTYTFRLMTIFHVEPDAATRNYFSRGDSQRDFLEDFCELGNLCCGSINHQLGQFFPHLGMSTPYVLDRACLPFIRELKPGTVSQHKLVINGVVTLYSTLCICAYMPVDFRVDTTVVVDAGGELELF